VKTIPQIEQWALMLLNDVEAGRTVEDARVELKARLPQPVKAARQLAGHANAAHGQEILWIVGVDEKGGIMPLLDDDLATWFSQVKSYFDGEAPNMTDVRVTCGGGNVLALLFETTRVPFVVKRDPASDAAADAAHREVPWRSGTAVRSARRHELLGILMPLEVLPHVEVLTAELMHIHETPNDYWYWYMAVKLYVVPRTHHRTVIPIHKCDAVAWIDRELDGERLGNLYFAADGPATGEKPSSSFFSTTSEIVFDRPGAVTVTSRTSRKRVRERGPSTARIRIGMAPVKSDSRVSIDIILGQVEDWKYALNSHAVIPEISA
jgi:hypothetical protein